MPLSSRPDPPLRSFAAGFLLLLLAAVGAALVLANSTVSLYYDALLDARPAHFLLPGAERPVLFWLNELLAWGYFYWSARLVKRGAALSVGSVRNRWAILAALPFSVLLPAGLLALVHPEGLGPHAVWLAASASDPLLVMLVLNICAAQVSPALRHSFTGFLAAQNLLLLAVVCALAWAKWSQPSGVIAALLVLGIFASARRAPLLAVCVAAAATLALLKAGLPVSAGAVVLGLALPLSAPRYQHGASVPVWGNGLERGLLLLSAPIFLLFNSGIALRGVDPAYVLRLAPMSIVVCALLLKPMLLLGLMGLARRLGIFPSMQGVNTNVLVALAVLSGASLTGQLYFAGLNDRVGNYHFDLRLAALCATAIAVLGGAALLARDFRRHCKRLNDVAA